MADAVMALGICWAPTAESVRSGYRNVWIKAAIAAIDRALDQGGRDDPGTD